MRRLNTHARHQKRRLQTPAHPCDCFFHRGGNCPRGEGHFFGASGMGLWRKIGYPLVEYGPSVSLEGEVDWARDSQVSPSSYRSSGGNRHWRGRRSVPRERRHERKLIKQARQNPNYPSKEFVASVPVWEAQGAKVTDRELVYQARLG